MKKMNTVFVAMAMVAMAVWAKPAQASSINVVNYSFENPFTSFFTPGVIAGWTLSNPGGQGVFDPSTYGPAGIVATDGHQTAYSNGGSISQTTGAVLTANTLYTLMIEMIDRLDTTLPAYSNRLKAGSNVLAQESILVVPNGGSLTSIVTYLALPGDPLLGQAIGIEMFCADVQCNSDNVRLYEEPLRSPVPEPATMAMFGTGLAFVARKFRPRKA